MVESNVENPIKAAADVVGPRATETFAVVSSETRLAIMLALWEAFEPFAEGEWDPSKGVGVPFSGLQERLGLADPDHLNYHLTKLEGEFIERTDDGYQLLPAGNELVRTIIASSGFEEPHLAPAEIDLDCNHCGAPTAVTYQNQRVYRVCTECPGSFDLGDKHPSGVLTASITNPTILRKRSPEEVYTASITESKHDFALRKAGVCPKCSGRIDPSLDVCNDHDPGADEPCPACDRHSPAVIRYACTACKHTSSTDIIVSTFDHPAVVGLAWKHGIQLGHGSHDIETERWLLDLESDQELVSSEPPRVRVTLRYEADEVQLTYDETLSIVEAIENY